MVDLTPHVSVKKMEQCEDIKLYRNCFSLPSHLQQKFWVALPPSSFLSMSESRICQKNVEQIQQMAPMLTEFPFASFDTWFIDILEKVAEEINSLFPN
jgi:hypothetical protein